MNYLELLDKELKETDWNLEHKRRYLYLRSCQLFTFDTRIYFVDPMNTLTSNTFVIEARNAKEIYQKMRSQEINLENVEDKRVSCFAWAKTYIKLVNELLGMNASYAENIFGKHAWTMMGHKADATADSDLTRVKMNLSTYGYILSTDKKRFIPDEHSAEKIKIIDQDISYIGKDYVSFKKLFLKFRLELITSLKNLNDMYNWWINKLIAIYKSYQSILLDFEDASYCLSYLFEYLFTYSNLNMKIVNATLFLDFDPEHWDFVDLYRIAYGKEEHWYLLSKAEVGYDFKEITRKEAHHYLSNYKGEKSLILQKKL